MKLHLRDKNPAVVAAWREVFAGIDHVAISEGDILELEGDAIVSPANSFGWMDGGIDLAYRERFGLDLEQRVQKAIASAFWGEMPVGEALNVETNDHRIPILIVAPTMRVPSVVRGTINAYLAMRAALIETLTIADSAPVTLLCPGLCTLTGRMSPMQAAVQMRWAWRMVIERSVPTDAVYAVAMHADMLAPR